MSKRHIAVSQRTVQNAGGPILLRIGSAGGGQSVVEMGIDYSQAQVPERAYYADYCEVKPGRVAYSLFFGKLIPATPKLRTEIEVTFPEEMFLRQLWGNSRDLHETARKVLGTEVLEPILNVEPTDKVQTFRANNVFMGVWGHEAVMDFYYISPRDMHFVQMQQSARATLEPIVRVAMETALLNEFLEQCRPYAASTEQKLERISEVVT